MAVRAGLCLLAALLHAVGAEQARWEQQSLSLLQDSTKSPVSKVVKLLTDMIDQMEKDAKADEDLNETMMCWCTTNEKERTQLIKDNTEKVGMLTTEIENLHSKSNELATELENLKEELAKNEKELDTSIALRKKEVAEFNVAEKDTMTTIGQLDGAVKALGPRDLMQTEISLDGEVGSTMKTVINQHKDMMWKIHSEREKRIYEQLMEDNTRDVSLLQVDGKAHRSMSAPSDMIHGMISAMNDAFKDNLKKLQGNEADSQAAHEAAKKAKKQQIEAGATMIQEKTQVRADTDEKHAASKEDLDDTSTSLEQDKVYLKNVKEQCELHTEEYAVRKKTRQDEIEASSKALAYLSSDDAKDMLSKTFGATKSAKKMGSRDLAEYKESRETTSKRSQTNKARKKQWGTSDRYLLAQMSKASSFVELSSKSKRSSDAHDIDTNLGMELTEDKLIALDDEPVLRAKKSSKTLPPISLASVASFTEESQLPMAKKLSNLAKRTMAYWSAQYYSEGLKANASKADAQAKKIATVKAARKTYADVNRAMKHEEAKAAKKHKLGLTASQMTVRKKAMGAVTGGIGEMITGLVTQQGEETSRMDWCADEIANTEKKMQTEKQTKDRLETEIDYNKEDIDKLKLEIKNLRHDQEDADIELQKASNDRKKANTAYSGTVLNQLASKRLLATALKILNDFYKKKSAALLRQSVRLQHHNRFEESAEKVAAAAGSMVGESLPSFSDTAKEEQADVSQAGEAGLEARGQELASEQKRKGEASKQTQLLDKSASVAPNPEASDDAKGAHTEGLAAKWLSSYNAGTALLQKSARDSHPAPEVQALMNKAHDEAADGEAMIKQAEAMAKQPKALLQSQEPDVRPPPPPGFKKYGKSSMSGGVTTMIQHLIDEADAMVKEAVKDETDSMTSYEGYVADSNAATDERQKAIIDKSARKGKLEGMNEENNEALDESKEEFSILRQTNIDLYGVEGCEYLMKNYETRYVQRQEEIDSLKEANAILGAQPPPENPDTGKPEEPPLEETPEAAGEEEEEEEAVEKKGSTAAVVPEGVQITGPDGPHNTAVSSMSR